MSTVVTIIIAAVLTNNFVLSKFTAFVRSWAYPRSWIPVLEWVWQLFLSWSALRW